MPWPQKAVPIRARRLGLVGRNRVYRSLWTGKAASMPGNTAALYALLLLGGGHAVMFRPLCATHDPR